MKIDGSHIIRKIREEMSCTQEELAERLHISARHLSRIETGESEVDIWQFMAMMELLGRPSEDFWLLYLDSAEYEEYKIYLNAKRFLREKRYPEMRDALIKLEGKALSKRPIISQFIRYGKITADRSRRTEAGRQKPFSRN